MKDDHDTNQSPSTFAGFDLPIVNWFRMPNEWTDICAGIGNLAELKVMQYILRHTWGYQEYGIHKHITIDEFVHGRKKRDGSRMDRGTGLAEQSVRNGLASAKAHGWVEEIKDETDKARIKRSYRLKMREQLPPTEVEDAPQDVGSEVQPLDPEAQELDPRGPDLGPRSETNTEKDTFEEESGSQATLSEQDAVAERHAKPVLQIAVAITEISSKLGDEQHLGSNKAQAMNLFIAANISEDRFVQVLYEASAVTRDEVHRRRHAGDETIHTRMAYFFSIVRKQLGLPAASAGERA